MTVLAKNIQVIGDCLRQFEQRYNRPPNSVQLLAVSKKQSIEKIRQANAAGLVDFGENYLQEALHKIENLQKLGLCWHFIGPVQTNKTRAIAEHFQWVHSVDRGKIAKRLSQQRAGNSSALNVCVQVNLANEESKSGTTLQQTRELCDYIAQLPNLRLRGLMAIPEAVQNLDSQRASFKLLSLEFDRLKVLFPTMDTLSMGMSNDFEAAIAEGSTLVRIGTALFGSRV